MPSWPSKKEKCNKCKTDDVDVIVNKYLELLATEKLYFLSIHFCEHFPGVGNLGVPLAMLILYQHPPNCFIARLSKDTYFLNC